MSTLPTRDELEKAIARIGSSRDGWMLRRYLQLEVNRICTDMGALPFAEGRRSFARELATLMDAGLAEVAALDRPSDTDEPVIREPAKPVAAGGSRGLARRVPADPDAYKRGTGGTGTP